MDMQSIKRKISYLLSHKAWAGVGVLVAVVGIIIAVLQGNSAMDGEEESEPVDKHRIVKEYDKEEIESGKDIHFRYCGKCHTADFSSFEDMRVGVSIAGQYGPYVKERFVQILLKADGMGKKEKKTHKKLLSAEGRKGIDALLAYYEYTAQQNSAKKNAQLDGVLDYFENGRE